jgi:hypothetical protein
VQEGGVSMTEPIRIPFLHPKGIYPPGRTFAHNVPGMDIEPFGDGSNAFNVLHQWLIDPKRDGNRVPSKARQQITVVQETSLEHAHVPDDLTGPEVMAVLRALAECYPEHVVVAADEVRSRTTEHSLKAWRHPDDVEAIESAWVDGGDNDVLESRISPERRRELEQAADRRRQAVALALRLAARSRLPLAADEDLDDIATLWGCPGRIRPTNTRIWETDDSLRRRITAFIADAEVGDPGLFGGGR